VKNICSPNVRAEDALESALAMYVAAKEPLPTSSEAEADEVIVPLSALRMAKAALYEAMREQGVGRAELARRLRWHLPQINRVLDLRHASRMEHVEAALAALGLRLIVDVARAA
jgi:antitoxin HicB